MRHRFAGKHLGRTSSHRKAMRRNMAVSLFQHGAIRTTAEKAKDLRRFAEKLITTARKGTLHARRQVISSLGCDRPLFDEEGVETGSTVVQKLFDEIAPRYAERPGGYTRIIRLAERRIGDAGSQVVLQLVEEGSGAKAGSKPAPAAPAEEPEAEASEQPASETADQPAEENRPQPAGEADATEGDESADSESPEGDEDEEKDKPEA